MRASVPAVRRSLCNMDLRDRKEGNGIGFTFSKSEQLWQWTCHGVNLPL